MCLLYRSTFNVCTYTPAACTVYTVYLFPTVHSTHVPVQVFIVGGKSELTVYRFTPFRRFSTLICMCMFVHIVNTQLVV